MRRRDPRGGRRARRRRRARSEPERERRRRRAAARGGRRRRGRRGRACLARARPERRLALGARARPAVGDLQGRGHARRADDGSGRALGHGRGRRGAACTSCAAGSTRSRSGWERSARTRRGSTRATSTRRSSRGGSRSGAARCRRARSSSCEAAPLDEELRALAGEGVQTLLLEGGPTLASAFFAADLVDKLLVFVAPTLAGTGEARRDAAPRSLKRLRASRSATTCCSRRTSTTRRRVPSESPLARLVRDASQARIRGPTPTRAPWEGGGWGRSAACPAECLALAGVHGHRARARTVVSVEGGDEGMRLVIEAPATAAATALGDSVSVDGVDLTATEIADGRMRFHAVPETLCAHDARQPRGRRRGEPRAGAARRRAARRPLRPGARRRRRPRPLGRARGRRAPRLRSRRRPTCCATSSRRARRRAGVALTVAELDDETFAVALIPYTLAETTLGTIAVGDGSTSRSTCSASTSKPDREPDTILDVMRRRRERRSRRSTRRSRTSAPADSSSSSTIRTARTRAISSSPRSSRRPTRSTSWRRTRAGSICLCLTGERCDELGLHPMTEHNETPLGTAFTVSIEAREGVTTGISAHDRSRTIQVAIHPDAKPDRPRAARSRVPAAREAAAACSSAPGRPRPPSTSRGSPGSRPPASSARS